MSDKIIHFEHGIPGFLEEKEFVFQQENEESPFAYLQSVHTDHLAFIVTSPFLFYNDYSVKLPDETIERLHIESTDDVVILTIVNLRGDISAATTNLLAPVVINMSNLQAEQIILEKTAYTTKHLLFAQQPVPTGGE